MLYYQLHLNIQINNDTNYINYEPDNRLNPFNLVNIPN